jgi:hypothetical protein
MISAGERGDDSRSHFVDVIFGDVGRGWVRLGSRGDDDTERSGRYRPAGSAGVIAQVAASPANFGSP